MKALITAGAVLAIAGAATATDFDMGSHTLGAGEFTTLDITLPIDVLGFEIGFDYDEPVADASWASDVQFIVSDADGAIFTVGGFTNVGNADVLWAFDGSGSTDPGFYSDAFALALPAGDYTLTFVNDWETDPNPNVYNNIMVAFEKVPTPGTVGLMGLAGLAAVRRRR